MNNLWHTNFRAEQDGIATFHYFFQSHKNGYDSFKANQIGLNNHQPLLVAAASSEAEKKLFFKIDGQNIYVEVLKPADDGNGIIAQIVSCGDKDGQVNISPQTVSAIKIWESNLLEEKKSLLSNSFSIPAKGIITIRIEK